MGVMRMTVSYSTHHCLAHTIRHIKIRLANLHVYYIDALTFYFLCPFQHFHYNKRGNIFKHFSINDF